MFFVLVKTLKLYSCWPLNLWKFKYCSKKNHSCIFLLRPISLPFLFIFWLIFHHYDYNLIFTSKYSKEEVFTFIYRFLEQMICHTLCDSFIHFFTYMMVEILSFGYIVLIFFIILNKQFRNFNFIMLDLKLDYLLKYISRFCYIFLFLNTLLPQKLYLCLALISRF